MKTGDKIKVKPSNEYITAFSKQEGTIVSVKEKTAIIYFPADGKAELPHESFVCLNPDHN